MLILQPGGREPTRFYIRVPHPVTICADRALNTPEYSNLPGMTFDSVPRARVTSETLGAITLPNMRRQIELLLVTHGEVEKLPDPVDNVVHVVSKLTIRAAMENGRPVDDLLFLYGDRRRPDGSFEGVKGLGRPHPVPRLLTSEPCTTEFSLPDDVSHLQLKNTCAYPGKIYAPGIKTASLQTPVDLLLPKAEGFQQTSVMYYDELDEEMTRRLNMPVYDTYVTGVTNAFQDTEEGCLRLVNPNVLTALGDDALARGSVTFHDTVRDENSGSILGGTKLAMFSMVMRQGVCI